MFQNIFIFLIAINCCGSTESAKVDITISSINQLSGAVKIYKIRNGEYPSTEEGWNALIDDNILEKIPLDSWGYPFQYIKTKNIDDPFLIFSRGIQENYQVNSRGNGEGVINFVLLFVSGLLNLILLYKFIKLKEELAS